MLLPGAVEMTIDGFVVHTETRSASAANPAIADGTFDTGTAEQEFDRDLADRGERTSHWLQAFAQLGFPKDGPYDLIQPTVLAPGIVLLDGVSNYTLVIERASGIVVVEGSVHDLRAEHVIDYIEDAFPDKPITHIVSLHHHADHNAGVRPYVGLGARLVAAEPAAAFWTEVLADRDARILPDRLDRSHDPAFVDAVGAEGLLLPDDDRPVSVYPEPTTHAADTAFVHVPDVGLLMVNGDTYGPGDPPGAGGASLQQQIVLRGLTVEQIAGAHGTPVTYEEFLAGLGARSEGGEQPLEVATRRSTRRPRRGNGVPGRSRIAIPAAASARSSPAGRRPPTRRASCRRAGRPSGRRRRARSRASAASSRARAWTGPSRRRASTSSARPQRRQLGGERRRVVAPRGVVQPPLLERPREGRRSSGRWGRSAARRSRHVRRDLQHPGAGRPAQPLLTRRRRRRRSRAHRRRPGRRRRPARRRAGAARRGRRTAGATSPGPSRRASTRRAWSRGPTAPGSSASGAVRIATPYRSRARAAGRAGRGARRRS